jgi:hypothetical protein
MPTVRDVYKIVAYFAQGQKLVLWWERESGMTITAHLAYARFTQAEKRSIAPWHKRWTHKGKPGKIRRWSAVQASFPTFAS